MVALCFGTVDVQPFTKLFFEMLPHLS